MANQFHKHQLVFMGNSSISAVCLKALLTSGHFSVFVITNPDKLGHRNQLSFTEVKCMCLHENVPFAQFDKLHDCISLFSTIKADFLLTCSFGKIIPLEILKMFKKCVNIHASLLPAYRGASPIQRAIQNEEKITGISLMEMNSELDAGKVYWQRAISIDNKDTFDSLQKKFFGLFDGKLLSVLSDIFSNKIRGIEQDNLLKKGCQLSFAPIITKEMCFIDWTKTSSKIAAHVRSLFSKPLAKTHYEDIVVKILNCSVVKTFNFLETAESNFEPGEILNIGREGILVATKNIQESILIDRLQLPNKNPINVDQLINGRHCFKKNGKFF